MYTLLGAWAVLPNLFCIVLSNLFSSYFPKYAWAYVSSTNIQLYGRVYVFLIPYYLENSSAF